MIFDIESFLTLSKRAVNRIGRPIGLNPFPRAFENHLANLDTPQAIFEEIYQQNYWGSQESRSGVGSEIEFTTRYLRRLSSLLQEMGLRRIFDAPSGDLNWIAPLIGHGDVEYFGGDISESVVDCARLQYPNVKIEVFDIANDTFPDADVWHCRDCLFHLPLVAIRQALENYVNSSIPYALITSHKARILHRNLDVGFGGFRFLDLEWGPFCLPPPIERIADFKFGVEFPRYVCLWSRKQIADAVTSSGFWGR